jgi:outer membrane receptor protein involved in Fe transport
MLQKGEFYQNSLTLSDGTRYVIPEMTTIDATVSYSFRMNGNKARLRFAVKNLEDERTPQIVVISRITYLVPSLKVKEF